MQAVDSTIGTVEVSRTPVYPSGNASFSVGAYSWRVTFRSLNADFPLMSVTSSLSGGAGSEVRTRLSSCCCLCGCSWRWWCSRCLFVACLSLVCRLSVACLSLVCRLSVACLSLVCRLSVATDDVLTVAAMSGVLSQSISVFPVSDPSGVSSLLRRVLFRGVVVLSVVRVVLIVIPGRGE